MTEPSRAARAPAEENLSKDALLRDCYEVAPGTRVTIARDPDGNAVEFIERRG